MVGSDRQRARNPAAASPVDTRTVPLKAGDAYDKAKPVRWPKIKGLDVLKHLMAEHGMNGADLSRILGGSRNLGAMILRGDRNLTLAHIRKLAAHFKVSPELFI